jgi:hypothetical protein
VITDEVEHAVKVVLDNLPRGKRPAPRPKQP